MSFIALAWRLLRYRVAVMLILFMLLGAFYHGEAPFPVERLMVAAAALAISYISATSINDIADEKIDAINHPTSFGRPLVTGGATRHQLYILFGIASVVSVALALTLGVVPGLLLAGSVGINILYSAPPFKLSHRTFVVPLVLATAYVGIPFILGAVVTKRPLGHVDIVMGAALYWLFVARINLKDFRDRAGDAAYGKPTLLLKYGKSITCLVSLAGLLVADCLLVAATSNWGTRGLYQFFIGMIGYLLWRLYRAHSHTSEQLAIGLGAKVGNALLIALCAQYLVLAYRAPVLIGELIGLSLAVATIYNVFYLMRHQTEAIIGYRG
jgi:4-hydroxybenzoate polyprenyltransferase